MNISDPVWSQPIQKAQELLSSTDKIKHREARAYLMEANYRLLFRIQIFKALWEQLLLYPDIFFRRPLYANSFGLSQQMISEGTGIASGTAHNLLNTTKEPPLSVIHTFAVMCNVPVQTIVEEAPNLKSFFVPTEYWYNGVAVESKIAALNEDKDRIRSIQGYWISDPITLFEGEHTPITARWVRSYPEMEYLEFHLNHEPALYAQKRKQIRSLFPFATHLVTTYTPLRGKEKRSFWILGPKPKKEAAYEDLLKVIEMREFTVVTPI